MKSMISASFALATLLSSQALGQETIKIGVIQPLTGSVAYNGTADVAGTKLAIADAMTSTTATVTSVCASHELTPNNSLRASVAVTTEQAAPKPMPAVSV